MPGGYGIEKRPTVWQMGKTWKTIWKQSWTGSKWQKNGSKTEKHGKLPRRSIFGPFLAPVQLWVVFHLFFRLFSICFSIFPHFGLLATSRPYQPGMIPSEGRKKKGTPQKKESEDAMGGGKKRGVENLTNDTPSQKGVLDPPSYGSFSTPLRCQCSVFPVQKSTTEQTKSSFGGVQKFSGERVLWYVSSPHTFCTPPYHGPKEAVMPGLLVRHVYFSGAFSGPKQVVQC